MVQRRIHVALMKTQLQKSTSADEKILHAISNVQIRDDHMPQLNQPRKFRKKTGGVFFGVNITL